MSRRERVQLKPNFENVLTPSMPVNQFTPQMRGNTATLQKARQGERQASAITKTLSTVNEGVNRMQLAQYDADKRADANAQTQYVKQMEERSKFTETRLKAHLGKNAAALFDLSAEERLAWLQSDETSQSIIKGYSQDPDELGEFSRTVIAGMYQGWAEEDGQKFMEKQKSTHLGETSDALNGVLEGALEPDTLDQFLNNSTLMSATRDDVAGTLVDGFEDAFDNMTNADFKQVENLYAYLKKTDLGSLNESFNNTSAKYEEGFRKANINALQSLSIDSTAYLEENFIKSGKVEALGEYLKQLPEGFYTVDQQRGFMTKAHEQYAKKTKESHVYTALTSGNLLKDASDFTAAQLKAADEKLVSLIQYNDQNVPVMEKGAMVRVMDYVYGTNGDHKVPRFTATLFQGLNESPLTDAGELNPRYASAAATAATLAMNVGQPKAKAILGEERYNEWRLYDAFTNSRYGDPEASASFVQVKKRYEEAKSKRAGTDITRQERSELISAMKKETDLSTDEVNTFLRQNKGLVEMTILGAPTVGRAGQLLAQTRGLDFTEFDSGRVFNAGHALQYAGQFSGNPTEAIDEVLETYAEASGFEMDDAVIEVDPSDFFRWVIYDEGSMVGKEIDMKELIDTHNKAKWKTQKQLDDDHMNALLRGRDTDRANFQQDPYVQRAKHAMETK
ncbi:hypothetical protein [Vibrio sp. SCSIO 43137]|uniref:hypothetical protein n=1 Tax=Vibrio sp. SCSIO 43137 TaxID=3021011 RepID=UPI0023080A77|nr:hypothetical protein [Vibrio sp. SCSIO 43137]WCE28416.1 hypothetical protein PK654_08495 [Vibrio sp. SCSIO 43137]